MTMFPDNTMSSTTTVEVSLILGQNMFSGKSILTRKSSFSGICIGIHDLHLFYKDCYIINITRTITLDIFQTLFQRVHIFAKISNIVYDFAVVNGLKKFINVF